MPEDSRLSTLGHEWFHITLSSIGDAVIATDRLGRIQFMNAVAESLTGWTLEQASETPLDAVFQIINEQTRQKVENPASRALREGLVVGLANHTVLIGQDGTERPIDDSASPIRDAHGEIVGVVLVFRDVTERRNAEQALQRSEERLRLMVDGTRDYAIFMLDPNGIITSWNPGAERIKGYATDDIVGKHFSVFYPPEAILGGRPGHALKEAVASGRFEEEAWRVRKDGSGFWADVIITALRDEDGGLRGYFKITRDLSERKVAEETLRAREERFQAMTRSAHDAIIMADDDGRISFLNSAAVTMFGLTQEEALGQPLTILMPERYRELHQKGFERLRATGESRLLGKTVEIHGCRSDGSDFPVELSLSTWTEKGTQHHYCGIIRDITERNQLERAKVQAEVMMDLDRRKDEFLAMLSHELRNPLAPILNAVQLLRLERDGNDVQHQARGIIERQAAHLARLVDDLLEVSRITTGRIRLDRVHSDLRDTVERAIESTAPLASKYDHELSVSMPEEPVWVYVDSTRMEQVVVNLLTNAFKYTEHGGRISLSLDQVEQEAILIVRDNGVGIAAELLPRIFDLFTQADRSLDRSEGGIGVGLTVVRKVVELHGGAVEASSDGAGCGSQFVVRLPLAEQPIAMISTPTQSAAPSTIRRVLVVDDNRDAADSTALLLQAAGHEVRTAYTGTTALAAAATWRPHAILLDIGLPEMDGYEIAQRLRSDPNLRTICLIALTGYGQNIDRARSVEAGFDVHLVKPVDPTQLRDVVSSAIGDSH